MKETLSKLSSFLKECFSLHLKDIIFLFSLLHSVFSLVKCLMLKISNPLRPLLLQQNPKVFPYVYWKCFLTTMTSI